MNVHFTSTRYPYLSQSRHINVHVWSPYSRTYTQYPRQRPDHFVYERVVREGRLRVSNTTPRMMAEQEIAEEEERLRREAAERRAREEAEKRAREEAERRAREEEDRRRARREEDRRRAEEERRRLEAQQQQEDRFAKMMRNSKQNRPEDRPSSSQDHRHRKEHRGGHNSSSRTGGQGISRSHGY